jgi:soluble lytic murein transglycosylase-like protein
MSLDKIAGILRQLADEIDHTLKEMGPLPAPAPADDWNAAFLALKPDGCSLKTALPEGLTARGVESSRHIAQTDLSRGLKLRLVFEDASKATGAPVALLMGIASRETHFGSILKGGWGDRGNGYGIMQVDKGSHTPDQSDGPMGLAHVVQAGKILMDALKEVIAKHPDWTAPFQLQGAVVAYNSGIKNVGTITHLDIGTTHDDYSGDVVARGQFYAEKLA